MSIATPKVFTFEYSKVTRILNTPCGISKAFKMVDIRQSGKAMPSIEKFKSIWDTGATNSAISKNVVKKLGLNATGKTVLYHAGGGGTYVDTYSICIFLPNNTCFLVEKANEAELTGADVLIGMDIISSGDFAVTASKGKTKFSFQVPSTHDIDFRKNAK